MVFNFKIDFNAYLFIIVSAVLMVIPATRFIVKLQGICFSLSCYTTSDLSLRLIHTIALKVYALLMVCSIH